MNSLLDFFTTPLGLLIAALILVVVVAIVFFALRSKPSAPREPVDTTKPTPATPPPAPMPPSLIPAPEFAGGPAEASVAGAAPAA